MLVGSIFVSSTVEVFLVGTSWLGLDSPVGVAASVGCAIVTMAAVAIIMFVAVLDDEDDDDDDDDGSGRDGGPPPPDDPGGEPAWWPQFERDLATYLSDRDRDRSGSETPPSVR